MSVTDDEIKIDFDEIDRKVAEGKADDAKKAEVKVVDEPIVEEKDDSEELKPEDGIAKLKKQLEDEKSARIAADRRADEASQAELAAKTESQDNRLHLVTNAIASITQASDALEQKYADAMAAQDFTAVAKINREMQNNAAKLQQLEQGKVALEKAPKPTVRAPSDPVEQFASSLSKRSADWVREHPDFVRNPAKNRQMLNAHQIAIDDGHAPDSPEYFDSIEYTLRIKKPIVEAKIEPEDDAMAEAAKPVRKAPPASAPVSRSGNGAGPRQNTVTLSRDEREIAKMMGMTDQEYAVQKVALKKEGKLN